MSGARPADISQSAPRTYRCPSTVAITLHTVHIQLAHSSAVHLQLHCTLAHNQLLSFAYCIKSASDRLASKQLGAIMKMAYCSYVLLVRARGGEPRLKKWTDAG